MNKGSLQRFPPDGSIVPAAGPINGVTYTKKMAVWTIAALPELL